MQREEMGVEGQGKKGAKGWIVEPEGRGTIMVGTLDAGHQAHPSGGHVITREGVRVGRVSRW